MRRQNQSLYKGVGLIGSFTVVLVLLFLPIFNGHNPMEYMDNLYNSISKGSAYYIPKVRETVSRSDRVQQLLALQGRSEGERVAIEGDLNTLLSNALADADIMYVNDADNITAKYGYDERHVLFDWWSALKAMEYELNKQKRFDAAKLVSLVQTKAVETSYNYYGIKAENIGDKFGIVLISLVFYVIYTLWYGFGILYLFEGFGMNLGH